MTPLLSSRGGVEPLAYCNWDAGPTKNEQDGRHSHISNATQEQMIDPTLLEKTVE